MVHGQAFLKGGGGWRFSYLVFSRLTVFTFTNHFTLQNCVMHLKKKFFLTP